MEGIPAGRLDRFLLFQAFTFQLLSFLALIATTNQSLVV